MTTLRFRVSCLLLTAAAGAHQSAAILGPSTPGTLDPSFSNDGKATIRFDIGGGLGDHGRAVAIQADGKIVVAGFSEFSTGDFDFAVTRLLPNGSLDSSFGFGGKATVAFDYAGGDNSDFAFDVAVQPDGKIVVAGQASYGLPGISASSFAVARLLPNGLLDPSFSGDGKTAVTFGIGFEYASALAIQPDGKIVLAGRATDGNNSQFGVARLHADGTLDTTFSGDGKQTIGFDLGGSLHDAVSDIALQPDGRIVLVGEAQQYPSFPLGGAIFAAARLLANGNLDTTFSNDGRAT